MTELKPVGLTDRASRLFLVNAGNTHTTTALYSRGRFRELGRQTTAGMTVSKTLDLMGSATLDGRVAAVVVAAVVPAELDRWRRAARTRGLPLLAVNGRLDPGVPVRVRPRIRLGADRLANVAAAVARVGAPVLAVDIGTAATFDAVTRAEGFIGGAIAPGPHMLQDALASGTAQLPLVNVPSGPLPAVGRSTGTAIGIGLRAGYAGLVRGIVAHMRAIPGLAEAPICLTGGAARAVVRDLGETCFIMPRLTLEGLVLLYTLNRDAAESPSPRSTKPRRG